MRGQHEHRVTAGMATGRNKHSQSRKKHNVWLFLIYFSEICTAMICLAPISVADVKEIEFCPIHSVKVEVLASIKVEDYFSELYCNISTLLVDALR